MDDNIKKLYTEAVEASRKLFEALNPTPEEIQFVNEQLFDIGMEDLVCDPKNPTGGGDLGLLAWNIYEMRELKEKRRN